MRQRLSEGTYRGAYRPRADCDRSSVGSSLSAHVPADAKNATDDTDDGSAVEEVDSVLQEYEVP